MYQCFTVLARGLLTPPTSGHSEVSIVEAFGAHFAVGELGVWTLIPCCTGFTVAPRPRQGWTGMECGTCHKGLLLSTLVGHEDRLSIESVEPFIPTADVLARALDAAAFIDDLTLMWREDYELFV